MMFRFGNLSGQVGRLLEPRVDFNSSPAAASPTRFRSRTRLSWLAAIFAFVAIDAIASQASAHICRFGWVINGPGSVTFWYGSYHSFGQSPQIEGSVQISGVGTFAMNLSANSRPAGFELQRQVCTSTFPSWQGVTVTGLKSGTYTFTTIGFSSSKWAPYSSGISSTTHSIVVPEETSGLGTVVSNFIKRRADQITASDPDLTRRLDNNGGSSGGNGFNFTGSNLGGNTDVAFSTSLSQIARANAAKKQAKTARLGDAPLEGRMALGHSIQGATVANKFDVWVEGKLLKIDADTANSKLGLLYVGADYRVSSNLLVGVLGQFDWADEDDDALGSNVDGRGWLVGPYVVARLHRHLLFDGRVAGGRSTNDATIAANTGSFDTSRWLVKGQLTGDFNSGGWRIAPHVGVIYFKEDQDAFTDSAGNAVGSQTVKLGRLTFGPRFSTTFRASNGAAISPFFTVKGIWDFEKDDTVNVLNGFATGSDDFRGRIEAGASADLAGGVSVKGEGFYDGLGADDYKAYGGSLRVTVPVQ